MTTEAQTIETAPANRPIAGSRRTALVAVVVVALAAGGAAFAASKLHGSSGSSAAGGFGGRGPGGGGGFAPGGQMPDGYGGGPRGRGPGFDGDRGPRSGGLSAAADYLGIPQATLFSDLQSGKSLAQIAQATSGKSVQGLIDAMVAAQKTRLKAAVSAGRLTQAQAEQLSAEIESRIADLVNGTFRGPGGSGGRGFGPPRAAGTTL